MEQIAEQINNLISSGYQIGRAEVVDGSLAIRFTNPTPSPELQPSYELKVGATTLTEAG